MFFEATFWWTFFANAAYYTIFLTLLSFQLTIVSIIFLFGIGMHCRIPKERCRHYHLVKRARNRRFRTAKEMIASLRHEQPQTYRVILHSCVKLVSRFISTAKDLIASLRHDHPEAYPVIIHSFEKIMLRFISMQTRAGEVIKSLNDDKEVLPEASILHLFVRFEKTFGISISMLTTVEQLKRVISARTGIPVADQVLTFGTRCMIDRMNLSDYNLFNQATLHLSLRLLGGVSVTKRQKVSEIIELGFDSDSDSDTDDVEVIEQPSAIEDTEVTRNAVLFRFDAMLDEIGVYYGQPQFSVILPKVWKVIAYAKERMRTLQPGILSVILQLKCPVQRKNHDDEFISLALGGNCPEELRLEICTVRCADELFGVENLANFSILCRVHSY